jgi:hypothetical protein
LTIPIKTFSGYGYQPHRVTTGSPERLVLRPTLRNPVTGSETGRWVRCRARTDFSMERDAVTTQELTTPEFVVPHDDVERSQSTASWSVAECGWKQILPDLPDDVIAMLATPVVVTAASLSAEAFTLRPSVPVPVAVPAVEECTPMFLAPAPSRRVARQNRAHFA